MLRKSKLTEIYKRFGFTEENTGNESIAVYSIKQGTTITRTYFH